MLNEAQDRLEILEKEQLKNALESEQLLHANQVIMRGLYAARLRFEIGTQRECISELELLVDEARSEYIEASKELEVLEKLKNRQKEEFRHEMDLLEGKQLDEFAVQRADKQYF